MAKVERIPLIESTRARGVASVPRQHIWSGSCVVYCHFIASNVVTLMNWKNFYTYRTPGHFGGNGLLNVSSTEHWTRKSSEYSATTGNTPQELDRYTISWGTRLLKFNLKCLITFKYWRVTQKEIENTGLSTRMGSKVGYYILTSWVYWPVDTCAAVRLKNWMRLGPHFPVILHKQFSNWCSSWFSSMQESSQFNVSLLEWVPSKPASRPG